LNGDRPCTAIVIAGPTATGKTALALEVAALFGTAIISADSRQCFREMTIGTAKPSPEELSRIPHYFIDSHSVTEEVNAGLYETLSLGYAAEVFKRNRTVVVCGGTGLYVKAFCEGLDLMPEVPAQARLKVRNLYAAEGIAGLLRELALHDPAFLRQADVANPHRLMRALEIWEASGRSILSFRRQDRKVRDFRLIRVGLAVPRGELQRRIDARTDQMMASGLVEEVRSLVPHRANNALRTVGYREILDYLDGRCTLAEAVDLIKVHTRQYAKRQMTWFRQVAGLHWFSPSQTPKILDFLRRETGNFG
jgi:tRNA dimethylallyltransferase